MDDEDKTNVNGLMNDKQNVIGLINDKQNAHYSTTY